MDFFEIRSNCSKDPRDLGQGPVTGFCQRGNKTSFAIKGRKTLNQLAISFSWKVFHPVC
jgi:hypothetical protein